MQRIKTVRTNQGLPRMKKKKFVFTLIACLALIACESDNKDITVETPPVNELYTLAKHSLEAGEFSEAANLFDNVERDYPYSIWATRSQLMGAYANYEANKYDEAIIGLDRFIQLHPSNQNTPYAYYLKALCYYEQITDVSRDQLITQKALQVLQKITRRYPQTKYARDALLKIDLTRDHLAGKEMAVGRYYLLKRNYLAAINRFQIVINKYQTTSHVAEALHRVVEANVALGLTEEAKKTGAVLGFNYPGSAWYIDTYSLLKKKNKNVEKPFLKRAWNWVF